MTLSWCSLWSLLANSLDESFAPLDGGCWWKAELPESWPGIGVDELGGYLNGEYWSFLSGDDGCDWAMRTWVGLAIGCRKSYLAKSVRRWNSNAELVKSRVDIISTFRKHAKHSLTFTGVDSGVASMAVSGGELPSWKVYASIEETTYAWNWKFAISLE